MKSSARGSSTRCSPKRPPARRPRKKRSRRPRRSACGSMRSGRKRISSDDYAAGGGNVATVTIRNLEKRFGDVRAVDGIDLSVEEREFLVLLGPSGCGKTTLLRMIAGLERQTRGDILIGGQVVNDLPPRARKIAMVFQSYALYPHMTVRDNIAFPLKAQGVEKASIPERVERAAAMFGIELFLNRKPRELSGGERQRVALARAVVREPTLFLLDEPLSNLDAKLRTLARDELKQFQRRIGTTTIYVTHDQIEAMGLGDRIVVMCGGKVRQVGSPQEVYDNPADTFVAGFLGSPPMNLLRGDDCTVGFRPERFLPLGVYEFAIKEKDIKFFDKATGRRTEPRRFWAKR